MQQSLSRLVHVLTCAVLIVLLLSLTAGALAQTPVRGGTLIVGVASDLPTLDPHRSVLTQAYKTLSPMYQALIDLGPNLELRPYLATAWRVSSDGLVWTFALRRGVFFHNGRQFTSREVKFSIERILNPKTGARGRASLASVDAILTPDPYTVEFKLKSPFGVFPTVLAQVYQAILPPEAFDPVTNELRKPIGTGPFQFVEWKTGEHLRLRRFDRYWETGKPYLDEVLIRPIPDETVRLTALQTGDVMVALDIPTARLRDLFARPSKDYVVRLVRGGGGQASIQLNTRRKPFDDRRVRQAIAYAMDKRELTEAMFRGWGRVVSQNFAPTSPWYLPVKERPRDLARAKQLLAEAGVPDGFRTTMTIGQLRTYPDVAQVFQAQMRLIGVEVAIQIFDVPTWVRRLVSGDFDAFADGYFPKIDPDDAYYRYFRTDAPVWLDGGFLSNPELDRLLDQGRAEADAQKRKEIYGKIVQIVQEESAAIFFGSGDAAVGWRTTVQGFEPLQLIGALAYPGGGVQETWLSK